MGWKAAQKLIQNWKIVRGDSVMIIRGKDRDETGLIKRVIRSQNRVIVEGKNLRTWDAHYRRGEYEYVFKEPCCRVTNLTFSIMMTNTPQFSTLLANDFHNNNDDFTGEKRFIHLLLLNQNHLLENLETNSDPIPSYWLVTDASKANLDLLSSIRSATYRIQAISISLYPPQ